MKTIPPLKKKNRLPEPDSLAASLHWDKFMAGDTNAFKAKSDAPNYRPTRSNKNCASCRFGGAGRCAKYKFKGDPDYTCDAYQPRAKEKMVSSTPTAVYAHGPGGLFSPAGLGGERKKEYKPPTSVQRAARRGLKLRERWKRGGLSTQEAGRQGIGSGVARATNLANGDAVSPATIGKMRAFFARHAKNYRPDKKEADGGPTAGTIAWLLWGGNAGKQWVESMKKTTKAIPMKKEADGFHPASHYLVVVDKSKPSTWHLRVRNQKGEIDNRLLGAAQAALTVGYRGNKYMGPGAEMALAKLRKLRKEAKLTTTTKPGPGHGPSIKNPKVYDALRKRGYDKARAAAISNAMVKTKDGVLFKGEFGRQMADRLIGLKHGKHDQSSHGRRGGGASKNVGSLGPAQAQALHRKIMGADGGPGEAMRHIDIAFRDGPNPRHWELPMPKHSLIKKNGLIEGGTISFNYKLPSGKVVNKKYRTEWGGSDKGYIWEDLSKVTTKSLLTVFKDKKGEYRWLTLSSNAYRDRDGEIVSTKALADDVKRTDRDRDYGPLRFWHMPGIDIGDADFSMMHGRTLIESGTFRNPKFAQAVATKAKDYQVSLGFKHPQNEPDENGVFHTIRRFERSLVPAGRAANPFTSLSVRKKGENMSAQKIKALKAMLDDDSLVEALLAQATESEKQADQMGVAFKESDFDLYDLDADELMQYAQALKAVEEEESIAQKMKKRKMEMEEEEEEEEVVAKMGDKKDPFAALSKKMDGYMEQVGKMYKMMQDHMTEHNSSTKDYDDAIDLQSGRINRLEDDLIQMAEFLDETRKEVRQLLGDVPQAIADGYRPTRDDSNVTGTDGMSQIQHKHANGQVTGTDGFLSWVEGEVA